MIYFLFSYSFLLDPRDVLGLGVQVTVGMMKEEVKPGEERDPVLRLESTRIEGNNYIVDLHISMSMVVSMKEGGVDMKGLG